MKKKNRLNSNLFHWFLIVPCLLKQDAKGRLFDASYDKILCCERDMNKYRMCRNGIWNYSYFVIVRWIMKEHITFIMQIFDDEKMLPWNKMLLFPFGHSSKPLIIKIIWWLKKIMIFYLFCLFIAFGTH